MLLLVMLTILGSDITPSQGTDLAEKLEVQTKEQKELIDKIKKGKESIENNTGNLASIVKSKDAYEIFYRYRVKIANPKGLAASTLLKGAKMEVAKSHIYLDGLNSIIQGGLQQWKVANNGEVMEEHNIKDLSHDTLKELEKLGGIENFKDLKSLMTSGADQIKRIEEAKDLGELNEILRDFASNNSKEGQKYLLLGELLSAATRHKLASGYYDESEYEHWGLTRRYGYDRRLLVQMSLDELKEQIDNEKKWEEDEVIGNSNRPYVREFREKEVNELLNTADEMIGEIERPDNCEAPYNPRRAFLWVGCVAVALISALVVSKIYSRERSYTKTSLARNRSA